MIRTKCILLPPTNSDGLRISILPQVITAGFPCEVWRKDLAPPDYLIEEYRLGEINLSLYFEKYLEYLQFDENVIIIKEIANYALHKRVTLLGMEIVPTLCHRTTLLYECWRYAPNIHIQNY